MNSFFKTWVNFLVSMTLVLMYPLGILIGLYIVVTIARNGILAAVIYFISLIMVLAVVYQLKVVKEQKIAFRAMGIDKTLDN